MICITLNCMEVSMRGNAKTNGSLLPTITLDEINEIDEKNLLGFLVGHRNACDLKIVAELKSCSKMSIGIQKLDKLIEILIKYYENKRKSREDIYK